MGPQGLGMVHLGVALRSPCTYCTLSAIIMSIHRELRITGLNLKRSMIETGEDEIDIV